MIRGDSRPRVYRPRVLAGTRRQDRVTAICLAHAIESLLTRDRDFPLFPELRTSDPFG